MKAQKKLTPEKAFYKAKKSGGTRELRTIACGSPYWAYYYAWNIDNSPRDDTRASACKDPKWAYYYAKDVDKCSNLETYKAILNSEYQEDYEKNLGIPKKTKVEPKVKVPKKVKEETPKKVKELKVKSKEEIPKKIKELTPKKACNQACKFGGTAELRTLVCGDPYWAYCYALNVDECPRDDTRKSACDAPYWAYQYALHIDEGFNLETYKAILNSEYQEDYEKELGIPKKTKVEPKVKVPKKVEEETPKQAKEPEVKSKEEIPKKTKIEPKVKTKKLKMKAQKKLTPEEAYNQAYKFGGTDELRRLSCEKPRWAYWYAKDVDKFSRDDTRIGACGDPEWAYRFTRYVDKRARDDTRKSVCLNPEWTYYYAKDVDKSPRDDTRKSASLNPEWAYYYAKNVDKVSRIDTYLSILDSDYQKDYENELGIPKKVKEVTIMKSKEVTPEYITLTPEEAYKQVMKTGSTHLLRAICCKDPEYAYKYALNVDGGPCNFTRKAACSSPKYAYKYALEVNGYDDIHEIIRTEASKEPEFAFKYAIFVDGSFHKDTYLAVLESTLVLEYTRIFLNDLKIKPSFDAYSKYITPKKAETLESFIFRVRENLDSLEELFKA